VRTPKPQRKPKPRRAKRETSVKRVTDLWYLLIKTRAGWKSELSGIQCRKPGEKSDRPIANAHHCGGKRNHWLRFEPRNGICLTQGEHIMGVHSHDPLVNQHFHQALLDILGDGTWTDMEELRDKPGKPNLAEVEAELTRQIEYYEKLNRRLP
jgi:hypothetical protein